MDPVTGAAIAGGIQTVAGIFTQRDNQKRQQRHNMELARFQHMNNVELLNKQLEYNTPLNQMKRYQEAGLNPNLIYGQGTPGNQSAPLQYPTIQPTDMSYKLPDLIALSNAIKQGELIKSQADLNRVKTGESTARQDLIRAQEALTKSNPYMSKDYLEAFITNMRSIAKLKSTEANYMGGLDSYQKSQDGVSGEVVIQPRMYEKFDREMKLLEQRFNLGNADAKIKAEVFKSKDFQNDLDAVFNRMLNENKFDQDTIDRLLIMVIHKFLK